LTEILTLPCRRIHEDIVIDGGKEKRLRNVILAEEITLFHKNDVKESHRLLPCCRGVRFLVCRGALAGTIKHETNTMLTGVFVIEDIK
jgi:hypothetical protein